MAKAAVFITLVFVSAICACNGFVVSKTNQEEPKGLFHIVGLDGGALRAHPDPGTGAPYPDPGPVVNEELVAGDLAQQYEFLPYDSEQGVIYSQENYMNDFYTWKLCSSCFPLSPLYYTIQAVGETGNVIIWSVSFLGSEKQCVTNNGLNQRITFEKCDFLENSKSFWRIVPVAE